MSWMRRLQLDLPGQQSADVRHACKRRCKDRRPIACQLFAEVTMPKPPTRRREQNNAAHLLQAAGQ